MDILVGFAIVVGFTALMTSLFRHGKEQEARRWRERWSRLSEVRVAGIEVGSNFETTWLTGRIRSTRLRVERTATRLGDGVKIVFAGNAEISLRSETLQTKFERTIAGRREIETGDEAFDREVFVEGSELVVRALLDSPTRAALQRLFGGRLRIDDNSVGIAVGPRVSGGDLHVEVSPEFAETLHRQLPAVVEWLSALAERLRPPGNVADRIARNNREEPEWRVRRANLRCLAERRPDDPATHEALRDGARDERPEVQLAAAKALAPNESRPLLIEIATRESAPDDCSQEAIVALGDGLPPDFALQTLGHALRSRRVATAAACLGRLGATRNPRFIEALAKVLAIETGPLASSAARALGDLESPEAEGPLLRVFDRSDPELVLAAVVALGQAGTAQAVPPLKDLEGKTASRAVRAAARQAVARIQSRLVGASPGQLSLAGSETGQLSLADAAPRGQLSLPEVSDYSRVKPDDTRE